MRALSSGGSPGMTRVAYVCADAGVPVFGHKGCSIHVREMCNAMLAAGFDITLFASRRGGNAPPGLKEIPVIDLPAPNAADTRTRECEAVAANRAVARALDVHGCFDIVYERASLWSEAPMRHAARTSAVGILELNAPLIEEQARYRTLVQTDVARALLRSSLQAARLVVAVSDEVAESARKLGGRPVNVHVVPNGVDIRRFTPRSDRRLSAAFVVGFVGTMKPWHGLPTLVEAFAMLARTRPEVRLLILGDGPERPRVVSRLKELGLLDRVTITGDIAHDDVPGLLAEMDVAVAPYPPLEGFYFSPLKLTEYMAAGLAVVASAIGQVTSLIRHGETGLLVTPGDAGSLALALQRLHGDLPLREKLGRAARRLVAERCTWASVLDRILVLSGFSVDQSLAPTGRLRPELAAPANVPVYRPLTRRPR
jgi:glycosyltransferase involved in cell wall biosynthesis